jgi:hypothetical protein
MELGEDSSLKRVNLVKTREDGEVPLQSFNSFSASQPVGKWPSRGVCTAHGPPTKTSTHPKNVYRIRYIVKITESVSKTVRHVAVKILCRHHQSAISRDDDVDAAAA